MKIQAFDGGASTRKRPQYIGVNQGVVYKNIDNELGTLASVKSKVDSGIATERYAGFFVAEQEWLSSQSPRDYVEFEKTMYWTDRVGIPQKYKNGVQQNLGIVAPTKLTNFSLDLNPDVVDDIKITTASNVSGLPLETTYYLLVNSDSGDYADALYVSVDTDGDVDTLNTATSNPPVPTVIKTDSTTNKQVITIANPVGITIGGDGVLVFRLYEGTWRQVGTLATSSSSLADNTENIGGNTELDYDKFGKLKGTYQYQLTYYNSTDGTESAPSPISGELDLTNGGTVTVNAIPTSSDAQVDKKRLYRIGGNLTALTQVVELDNSTTSFLDNLRDTEVVGTILDTSGSGQAPSGLSFLVETYAMFFGAEGSKLRFTPIADPDSWPELFFIQYDADITGLAPVSNGLLVFTKFRAHLVTGTGPTSLSTQLLTGDQGCISHDSVKDLGGAAIWASTDGLCVSNGSTVQVVTKDPLGKIELTPVDSVIFDEVYYVLNDDQSILAMDYRYGTIFKYLSLGVESLARGEDTLYGWTGGTLHELFASSTLEKFEYTSPRFVEGSASEHKTYKKVYIYSKGDIIINILIDDVVVFSRQLTDEDSHVVQVPQDKQRGHFIQFQLEGTGEVYEIEYEVGRRQSD